MTQTTESARDTGGVPGVDRRHTFGDLIHERTNFKILAHTKVYLAMFLIVIIGGPLLLVVRPLNLGIDFKGGISWQVTVAKGNDVTVAGVRKVVDGTGIEDYKATISNGQGGKRTIRVQAQVVDDPIEAIRSEIAKATGKATADVSETTVGGKQTFTVTKVTNADQKAIEAALAKADLGGSKAKVAVANGTVTVSLDKPPASIRDRVAEGLADYAGVKKAEVSISTVGPTWGGEVSRKAITALLVFFLVLAIYLSIRFEFKMAMAALVAVVHDIVFTAAVYSIAQFTVSPATVTAFLTILGFSLYDTVVVFDKIRENQAILNTTGKSTYTEMANKSLNDVLMRSLSTSFVALMPVASLLIVGVGIMGATALEDFALALFAGLLVGAYSSIFVATPLLVWWKEREPQYRALRERREARSAAASRNAPRPSVVDAAAEGAEPDPSDWDTTGVAGPPAVMRSTGSTPRPRQQRGRKRT